MVWVEVVHGVRRALEEQEEPLGDEARLGLQAVDAEGEQVRRAALPRSRSRGSLDTGERQLVEAALGVVDGLRTSTDLGYINHSYVLPA